MGIVQCSLHKLELEINGYQPIKQLNCKLLFFCGAACFYHGRILLVLPAYVVHIIY